ncbi:hypothetical protein PPYR_05843 [Photinus pyralis]|uniref:DDE-1 domain-containing protein n=1 Tax=Photinus pyralis TaxID=7054 RepID=A0A5N4AVX8_PHOPY|nr:hypothetical protein PPYR_05843 [Photinus pyralis]
MVRTYKKKLGARSYKNYSDENLAKAVEEVRSGQLSQKAAAEKYKINRTTILNRIHHKHEGNPGHPPVLTPEEEKIIAESLGVAADWGFPMTKKDIRSVIEKFVSKQGRNIPQWHGNVPGYDFVNDFAARNNLSHRLATNIKIARSSVGVNEITEFFENLRPTLEQTRPDLIYNYDETNITDDPGAQKVLVPRGRKRVERVKEHSKSSISIMFCGTAGGEMIPPMVVYKAKNLYDNWIQGGPSGTVYSYSSSGWFDMLQFEIWFFKILLPHIKKHRIGDEKVVVMGDNLASHFAPEVIKTVQDNNIYFTTLTPNSTHMLQPLDVGIFAPMKKQWRKVLDQWRQESRRKGTIPKEQFPVLLKRLMDALAPNMEKNLKSAFRATGIHPFDPQVVLRKLPSESTSETGRVLDESLLDFLKETRGYNANRIRHQRGKKLTHKPGAHIGNAEVPTTKERNTAEDTQGASSSKRTKDTTEDENFCSICQCDFRHYRSKKEWICCVTCLKWVCGNCNKGSLDPSYECERCEDED